MLILDQLRKNESSLQALSWVVAGGLFVLAAGLYYVQIISSDRFRAEQKSQSFRSVRLPAIRGKILDRNGTVLAENRPSYHVSLYLEDRAIRDQFKDQYRALRGSGRLSRSQQARLARQARYLVVSNLVAQLSAVLQEPIVVSEAGFTHHYDRSLALPFSVMADLNPRQIARFAESAAVPPGFDLEVRSMRFYPYQTTAAHVLGYLRRDDGAEDDEDVFFNYRLPDYRGDTGIELTFNEELKGRRGAKSVLVNNLGYRQSEYVWSPAQPGQNVKLTLDLRIQKAASFALSRAMNYTRGAVVVLDVRNGDVLALASAPGYNPNDWIPRLAYDTWTTLTNETLRPMVNRTVHGTYAPASIFKLIVGLAALEAGWDPTNLLTSPGYAQVGSHRIRDTAPAGDYDFQRALKLSCNKYFVDVGLRVGLDRIISMAKRFHLGEKTGIDLRPESSGILPTREWIRQNRGAWFEGDTANLSIGQGDVLVTPLQVALMIAAVANGGTVFHPRLVERIEPQDAFDPASAKEFPPSQVRSRLGVSARSLEILRRAMLADVEDPDGTGRFAALPAIRIAAKTGTAEIKRGRDVTDKTTWFASFGPYESPRYAVVVMVESGVSGGGTCGPVARAVYQALVDREKSESRHDPQEMTAR